METKVKSGLAECWKWKTRNQVVNANEDKLAQTIEEIIDTQKLERINVVSAVRK